MTGYFKLVGDSNWLYIAGGGTNENIIKRVDGSGDMVVNSTHTLTNGRKIKGIAQSDNFIYVTCVEDGDGVSSPRVIKVTKANWAEVVKVLSAIDGDNADSVGPIIVDGSDLIIGGSVETAKAALWTIAISDFDTITASYKYTTFQANRVYEDLKEFTELDPGTRISIPHHNYLDFVFNTSEDARVYKDYGVDHFGTFTHKFKFELISCEGTVEGSGIAYPYFLSNVVDDASTLHDTLETFIGVMVTKWVDGEEFEYRLYLHEDYDGSSTDAEQVVISLNTPYYCSISKSGTTFVLHVYSTQALLDAGEGGDIAQRVIDLDDDFSFEFLFAGNTYNDGTNKTCDLDIENLDIGEVTTPGQIETIYADPDNAWWGPFIYVLTTNGMCYKINKADLTLDTSNYIIPTGSSHIPKMECYFYTGEAYWNDLYWVTGCSLKHLFKLRTGVLGLEQELADNDGDWTSFSCAVGSVGSDFYLYVGSGNINEIKKVDIVAMSVDSTLALSTGTLGINALWSN